MRLRGLRSPFFCPNSFLENQLQWNEFGQKPMIKNSPFPIFFLITVMALLWTEQALTELNSHDSAAPRPRPQTSIPSSETTLTGQVQKRVGNFMPERGNQSAHRDLSPLQTKLYIFKGKFPMEKGPFFAPKKNQKAFAVIPSDASGRFSVQLPPGEYTIFLEVHGQLYSNSFDGDGNFSSIKVSPSKKNDVWLWDDTEAIF
jgi:hypothetical protein